MSDGPARRHPLQGFLATHGVDGSREAGVVVTVRTAPGFTNLRLDADASALRERAEDALAQPLPVQPNTLSRGARTIYWLGPDEWLIECGAPDDVAGRLAARLDGHHAAVTAQDGGFVRLDVGGGDARTVLAKGCTLDLRPQRFGPGACAQSALAKAPVLLAPDPSGANVALIVRRSYADYVARWLAHGAAEYGVRFAAT